MAEDKNGFLLYKDLIKTVQKLPKDKAGELFMHILKYVNDEEPETDDLLIEVAFEPVKQKLKRDLKKYEETKEKNRENANKRWQKEKPTESSGTKKNATASDRIPEHAKHADSDSDTGNDSGTDSDTDFLLEKETKEEKLIKENSQELFSDSETVSNDKEKRKKVAQKKEKQEPPDLDTFIAHAKEIYQIELKMDFSLYEFAVRAKYQSWIDAGWKDGHKKPIQAWKNKLRNLIPYLKPIYGKSTHNNSNNGFTKTTVAGSNATSGKTSATTAIARQLKKLSTGNSESGDITIDVEIV